MRVSSFTCSRSISIAWNDKSAASNALLPCSGLIAAWLFMPWKVTTKFSSAIHFSSTEVLGEPCDINARSSSFIYPLSSITIVPPRVSSAGVPYTTIVHGYSDIHSFTAIAAPIPAGPWRWCPHACPIFSSASYSTRIPITGPPLPFIHSARNAVGNPVPLSTSNPSFSR